MLLLLFLCCCCYPCSSLYCYCSASFCCCFAYFSLCYCCSPSAPVGQSEASNSFHICMRLPLSPHSLPPLPLLLSGYAERNVNLYKCCCCCRPATPTMPTTTATTTTSSLPQLRLAALSVEGSFYNLKHFFFEATTEAFVACLCCPRRRRCRRSCCRCC